MSYPKLYLHLISSEDTRLYWTEEYRHKGRWLHGFMVMLLKSNLQGV